MTTPVSDYLNYLPASFRDDPFMGRFLLTFQRLLNGRIPGDTQDPFPDQLGFEEYLDRIHTYFNPGQSKEQVGTAPPEFLLWLAGWVALSLREDWDESTKRRFISQIVPLYRKRGTKAGVKEMLELYTQEQVTLYEFEHPAHYFQVEMTLSEQDRGTLRRKQQIARTILDREKPAHTFYTLRVLVPTMQIRNDYDWSEGRQIGLRIGMNTLLGTTTS
ncbi:phage tail protein [Myxacorys almedinensis]|uniref:Phage tail protein I n=1 Tax=Myxacorys almedinensis A TaxID=2690445 RepID=A0A8J8CH92_9CYAN|nr:phage tail protein [Myxacorys almedinensis]NDJ16458.1 phage tail protein I [Myxacorys almedinensis A]